MNFISQSIEELENLKSKVAGIAVKANEALTEAKKSGKPTSSLEIQDLFVSNMDRNLSEVLLGLKVASGALEVMLVELDKEEQNELKHTEDNGK